MMSSPRPFDVQRVPGSRRTGVLAVVSAALLAGAWALGPQVAALRIGVPVAQAPASSAARPSGFADMVEKVKPAVFAVRVSIQASSNQMLDLPAPSKQSLRELGTPTRGLTATQSVPKMPSGPGGQFSAVAEGSGFFISPDGYAVTNQHVVEDSATVDVITDDGRSYSAKVIGSDAKSDLALLKVDGRSDFPYVQFAARAPRVGDWVVAVGNPFGLDGTVTAGIVSARARDIGAGPYDDFIQIDAPVNRGNSGGPAFDIDGGVIGVNTAIFSPSGGSVGIAFATPADIVKTVIPQIRDKGMVTRGYIGVEIQPVNAEIAESLGLSTAAGALVAEPQSGGPAARAGIAAGDVIVSVNGERIKDSHELMRKIAGLAPGSSARMKILRNGNEETVAVTVTVAPVAAEARAKGTPPGDDGERPRAEGPRLGLSLAPAAGVLGSGMAGLVITQVEPDGRAARQGLDVGDVILEVAGRTMTTPADFQDALSTARNGGRRSVLTRFRSGERTRFVALPVG
jgi:serine protease Do